MLAASKFNKTRPSIVSSKLIVGCPNLAGMDVTLHRSPRNPDSFRIKRRAFRLVPHDGGLLVIVFPRCVSVSHVVIDVDVRLDRRHEMICGDLGNY